MDYTRKLLDDTLQISHENGDVIFSVKESVIENGMLFELSGELINEIAYEFEDELNAVLTVKPYVRIDLSKLNFISSTGLHTLIQAQQLVDGIKDGRMVICGVNPYIKEVFEQNGFTELFCFELPEEGNSV